MHTLKDIAKSVGVAEATVSMVLRGKGRVSQEMRTTILATAKRLRYRPNRLILGAQSGSSSLVGVMMPTTGFYAPIFSAIQSGLMRAGYAPVSLLALCGKDGTPSGPSELDLIHLLVEFRVAGIILSPTHDREGDGYLHEILELGVPLVIIDRSMPRTHADFVGTDDVEVGRLAAEHLLSLGHRRLGHIAGPDFTSTAHDRRVGFEETARRGGAEVAIASDESFLEGAEAMRALLTGPSNRVTGVFASTDHQAVGACQQAQDMGLRIPRDVSIVGCADLPVAEWLSPPLTTVRQPAREIGEQAVATLTARIGDPVGGHKTIRLAPKLVVRHSTAAFPSPGNQRKKQPRQEQCS